MFPRPVQQASPAVRTLYQVALPVALLLWLLPLLGVALTSVRPSSDLAQGNYFGWPSGLAFSNYVEIFYQSEIARYMWNSLRVTIPTVIGCVILSSLTGFAGNFVPFQILMVPVRDLTYDLGLINTSLGLVLFHVAFQTGFCTLFMRNFIRALPKELIEAARVEGVAEWRIFWFIVVPLMRPAIAALSVLVFTFIWNDFFWATVLTTSIQTQPVTAGIQSLNGQWIAQWHLVSAGSIVAALPPVTMFFLMQKHFIAGLTLGAVK
jgi:multiple sugar transport system permease protein